MWCGKPDVTQEVWRDVVNPSVIFLWLPYWEAMATIKKDQS